MLIKNIRIVDPVRDFTGDVQVNNGIISALGCDLQGDGELYDYAGKNYVLVPAFTDLHAHFRDPGFTYKEDVVSGSMAAVKGGYSAVNLMPNTKPVCSSMELVRDVQNRIAALNSIFANQTLSMTKNLEGNDIEHLKALKKGELLFVTDDGRGVNDDEIMEEIFEICKEKDICIMAHEEDARFSASDMRLAENNMTFRDLRLCEKTGGRIHFCHVSTKEVMEAIAKVKAKGFSVTCEVTPHHISATAAEANYYRVNPPFREQQDIDALINAMQTGVVDAIATDHAPHSAEDKLNGSPGMTGLEIAFPLCYTKLVKDNFLTLPQLVRLMSTNPSKMMKLNKGKMEVGMKADFAVLDLNTPFVIDSSSFVSKGKNTPFNGKKVYGKIISTFIDGRLF